MKRKPISWFKVRIIFISCLLFIGFAIVTGRMFQLQVLKKEQLYALAAQQHRVQVPLVAKRGAIYDRQGNELAVSIEVDSIYADGRKIVETEKTASVLAAVLKTEREELKARLKSRKSFEWIERKVPSKEAAEIKALRLPGIFSLKETQRFYPNGQLASHVVGFVGLDSKGLEGIEFQHDALLNGRNQVWMADRDALGREIVTEEASLKKKEEHYRNMYLTLDKHIQHVVETELGRGVQQWGAKGGFAVAMEPSTGKVLALASCPFFNPNEFIQSKARNWRNRAVCDSFEPGSLFKTFLAAAALEENAVKPSDSFYCENGAYKYYDRTIHDHSKHGWLTFQQIIKVSSNIGALKVGEKLGKDTFYRYVTAFGFGEKTQVGLPGEAKGILSHARYWSAVTLGTISYGQGISITGIQLAAALSAIANGGLLMKPSLVEKITDEKGGVVETFHPKEVRRVVSSETAKKVTALLRSATEKGGTGEAAVPAGYDVAGKTGTAQKADAAEGGYSEDRVSSGFMGFGPADEPRIVLAVVIDEPQGSSFGGIVAAPVFRAIMEKVLPYLSVHPKGTLIVKNEEPFVSRRTGPVSEPAIDGVKVGKGIERVVMPDLTGLSMRMALSRVEGKGLVIRMTGSGKVVEQSPRPGMLMERGDVCYIKLQSSS